MTRWLLLVACVLAPALSAQTQESDSAPSKPLLREFRQRWHEHVQEELGLTPDQAAKLQATEDRFATERRPIAQNQRQVQMALHEQLRPGVAADADSVNRLMATWDQNRGSLLRMEQEQDQEMAGYLSPVQRARYQMMRQQLQERIGEMRRRHRDAIGGPGRGRDTEPAPAP